MKKTIKKFISTSLCIIMMLSSAALNNVRLSDWLDTIVFSASAETYSGKCGDNITSCGMTISSVSWHLEQVLFINPVCVAVGFVIIS